MRAPGSDTVTSRDPNSITMCNDLKIVAEFEGILRANGLDSAKALLEVSTGHTLDKPGLESWRERLQITLNDGTTQRTFFLKRFVHPPASATREVVRSGTGAQSPAGLEWAWALQLAEDGIRCVQPVALAEKTYEGQVRESAILTERVPGTSLEKLMQSDSWPSGRCLRELSTAIAMLTSRLHQHGYVHRDLYACHIFHDATAPDSQCVCLIDLQRVLRPKSFMERWFVKDLASLNFSIPRGKVSRTERLRWMMQYLNVTRLDARARRLIYRILGKTQRIARHDQRRNRRLATGSPAP